VSSELLNDNLVEYKEFILGYEKKFVEYFVSLYSKNSFIEEEKNIIHFVKLLYRDIFFNNTEPIFLTDESFSKFLKDKVLLKYLLNQTLFYMLNDLVCKKNSINIKIFLQFITNYLNIFEEKLSSKKVQFTRKINFGETFELNNLDNILSKFKKIQKNDEVVNFFNLYKGIPIVSSGKVLKVEDSTVAFLIEPLQEVAMRYEQRAYILKDANFDRFVKADIKEIEFSKKMVILENFSYLLNMPAMDRKYVRVYPDISASVKLFYKNDLITDGKLYDLSLSGLGVISSENNGIFAGASVEVSFELPLNDKNYESVNVHAEVVHIVEYKDAYKYCMRIYPSEEELKKIKKYVEQRKKETLKEIREEFYNLE